MTSGYFKSTYLTTLGLLFLMLVGTAPAAAQSNYNNRIIVGAGSSLNSNGEPCFERFTPFISTFMISYERTLRNVRSQRGLFNQLRVRAAILLFLDDWPWPFQLTQNQGGGLLAGAESWAVTGELVRPFRVGDRFEVGIFAGGGGLWRNDYRPDDVPVTTHDPSWNLIVTYGTSLGYDVSNQWQILGQVRGITHFLGNEDFINANNVTFTADAGNVTLLEFLIGVAYRFGG